MLAVEKEFAFPNQKSEMATIRFSVALSDAENIKWDVTWRGLLGFFAICSHEVYLELAEALRDKCGDKF